MTDLQWLAGALARLGRVLIILSVTSCAYTDTAALVASTATLTCDWGQTHSAAARGWERQDEANPLLGPKPSLARVDAYFGALTVLTTLGWYLLPPGWRTIGGFTVAAVQSPSLSNNFKTTQGLCGL